MNKILVDTNVLIYAIDADSNFHKSSLALISDPDTDLYTTTKNISEFLVVLTRAEPIKVEVNEAIEVLTDLLSQIKVLYPNQQSSIFFFDLLKEYRPSGLLIHDFEIISIGLSHGISRIATRNIADFKKIKQIQIEVIN